MAFWTPPAVLAQISLGALYRHQITGVMPHMLGAMVVALLTLGVSVILLQHFPDLRELKSAATALISAVLAQVCLGIAVFFMLLLGVGNIPAFAWLATGHVCVGTLTFAAGIVTAMQVGRYLSPAP
jgi:heme A synthase